MGPGGGGCGGGGSGGGGGGSGGGCGGGGLPLQQDRGWLRTAELLGHRCLRVILSFGLSIFVQSTSDTRDSILKSARSRRIKAFPNQNMK